MNAMTIGIIGLGPLGQALTDRLRTAGHEVWVFDPSSQVTRVHVVQGGRNALATPEALAGTCDIIIIAIERGDLTTSRIMLGPTGLAQHARPGTIVVDMASIDPALPQAIAAALVPRGAALVDAATVGDSEAAAEGGLTLLCSGPAAALEACRSVLGCVAGRTVVVGEAPGAARIARAAARLYGAINLAAAAEVLLIARRAGIASGPAITAMETLAATGGLPPADLTEGIASGRFASDYSLDDLVSDLDAALDTARSRRTPSLLSGLVREMFEAARNSRPGARGHMEFVHWLEANAGLRLADPPPDIEEPRYGPVPIGVRS